jgi:predicted RNA methylase
MKDRPDPLPMTPATILVRAHDLQVHLGDADDVSIVRGEERFLTTPHALQVLAAFAHPRSVGEVLDGTATGPQDWIELSTLIHQLARAGILRAPGAPADTVPRGYATPPIHVAMLEDQVRTRGFIDALRALVSSGDVVLDIGTGTGVLATAAALAGAARVNAVESSAIADMAERIFSVNGVADRVSLVRGRSTKISLPERCNLLVTEMIGNDPLDEHLLEIVDDAKKRLLTPDARLIPSAIEIFGVPVDLPRRVFERRVFGPERLAAWRELYGIDFSPLAALRQSATHPFTMTTKDVVRWPRVAPPVRLIDIDLTSDFEVSFRRQVSFAFECAAERLGVLLAFRATLAPGIVLSTLPDEVDPENHWWYGLWASYDHPSFAAGATATIDYAHGRGKTTLSITPG